MQQIQIQCSMNFLDKKTEDYIFQVKNSLKHHTPISHPLQKSKLQSIIFWQGKKIEVPNYSKTFKKTWSNLKNKKTQEQE